ncbi:MAG: efflux RND transporter periplasmic adaptor subunit, partial [Nitrospirota bacterium]|nr:efflux RND transporter periplasmic adaptor subunit [Nitrospirota bacterium]
MPTLLVMLLLGVGIWYWFAPFAGSPHQADTGAGGGGTGIARGPVATVTVIALQRQRFEETLTAYGTTEATPGESQRFTVPYESRVRKVQVSPGQIVLADTPLMEIEPSHETRLQLDSAREERGTAGHQLDPIQERLQMNLATRQDLLQAKQHLRAAEIRVQSLEKRGTAHLTTLHATSPGIVSVIPVREGQIVSPGTPLLETIDENKIAVRLGIELEDMALLQTGQAVRLIPVHRPVSQSIEGHIRLIAQEVNLSTRLVDVLVAPGPHAGLLLNEYVRGEILVEARDTFVVSREAVVPTANGYLLYTVSDGSAKAHRVQLRLETDQQVEVQGDTLKEGQLVAVIGSSQLHNGMAVTVVSSP